MELRDLTDELVSIPSHESEAAAGDRIERWLREETDAEVRRDDAGADDDRGGSVFARKGDGDVSLALVGHHDVVPPDDEQTDGEEYVVAERDGRLYGRGAADMKGAVAAAMLAFRDADPPEGLELVFASFVGEEVGGVGSQHAVEAGFAPDYAVVGEGSTGYSAPGVTDVAVVHRGRRASTVIAHGESAHASEPDAGKNAVYRACDAVDVLRALEPPGRHVPGADATVEGSMAVTMADGGSAWNVIPDRCEVTVDERTVPDEDGRVAGIPLERVEEIGGVEVRIDQDWPAMRCDDEAFVGAVLDAADAQAGSPEAVVKPHATDAGWLAAAGTQCVVCGPAELGEAHTADESVSLDALARCYEVYRGVAENPDGARF
jgi:acetylornithine deacetylase